MNKPPLQRWFLAAALLLSLVLPASATWSIVVVNLRTGEVGVASATCLEGFDLETGVPVIVVGKGAAAAQSAIDLSGANRQFIFNSLSDVNADPQAILDALAISDRNHKNRQYGILSLAGGGPVTFTGRGAGDAASGVTGQVGDYVYAIQGNVLTADAVVLAAESAFVANPGDMGQRLMAAMQGARALGGDGRCSCSTMDPTDCGAPPPGFTKSAHCGFVIVARMGDRDGVCNSRQGCSTGSYYLNQNVKGAAARASSPDPVQTLQNRYDRWRSNRIGRPDGLNFDLRGVDSLPADGQTQATFSVHLADVDGTPLSSGGANVSVRHLDPSVGIASIGAVLDNGDGSYTFSVTAGTSAGMDQLVINADDGFIAPDLYPYLSLRSDAVPALHLGYDSVSLAAGDVSLPLQFNLPAAGQGKSAGRYVLLAGLNGTSPGTRRGPALLPLNEPLIILQAGHPVRRLSDAAIGSLDAQGRASVSVDLQAAVLMRLVGGRLDFAAFHMGAGGIGATNAVGVQIVP